MSKINKIQKYAVLWLNHSGWDVTKIAQELELTDKQIEGVLLSDKNNSNKIKTKSAPVSKNLMIRETANKKSHVAIMTKESSMINDETKKTYKSSPKNKDIPGIYRPNGN